MKKTAVLLLIALLLALAGCGGGPAPSVESPAFVPEAAVSPTAAPAPVTFTDDLGRSVTVAAPKRVAPLLGSFCQTWCLAGGAELVCASADDAWDDFDLPLPADAVNLGGTKDLSLEKLLSSEPDLVIASMNTAQHLEWQETLEKAGITVAYFDVTDFDDYLRFLKVCTDLTGNPQLYEEYGAKVEGQVNAVIHKAAPYSKVPSVLSLRASASWIRAKNSEGNVLGEMLKNLGCVNIADADDTLLENLSVERILQADPDFIFFVQSGDDGAGTKENIDRFIAENPAWQQLRAVKEGRVYILEKELYNLKPNERWGEAYEKIFGILYEGN